MPNFYERVDAIVKECISIEQGTEAKEVMLFSKGRNVNYNKKLGKEKFIHFYESLSLDEQTEFLEEITQWAQRSGGEKNNFLNELAKPVFIHCLKDQQRKGMYSVPIDLFTANLKSFLEELTSEFPMLERVQKYEKQLSMVADHHNTDVFRRPMFVELDLGSETCIDSFVEFAERFNRTQLKQSELNLGVKKFAHELMPHASELFQKKTKPTVVLKVNNFCDGVGDAQTLFTMAVATKNMLVEKGYRVVGLLELMGGGSKKKEIRAYVKQALETSNPFDMLYILDNNPINERIAFPGLEDRIMVSGEERPQYDGSIFFSTECSDTASKDIKENAVLYINILFDNINFTSGAQGNYATLADSLTPAGLVLDVGEPGQILGEKNTNSENHYLSAHLGLPSKIQKDLVNGLLLQPQIPQENLVDEFKKFKNQNYIRALLGSEKIDQNVLLKYQQTHKHMIGYLQTTRAGNLYVLSTILRYYNAETRTLSMNCDIHLNAGAIDKKFLQDAFNGLKISNVEFVTPDSLESQQQDISSINREGCGIRIFSGFRLEHHDYQALYSLSEEPAGCSGDNSFADAGQRRLPFPGIISDKNQFASYFAKKQLLEFTKEHNLNALHGYFENVTMQSQSMSNPNELSVCFQIAKQLNSETLWQEWQVFSNLLKEQYNYFDNFPGIIDKCLKQVSKNIELLENMHQSLKPVDGVNNPQQNRAGL